MQEEIDFSKLTRLTPRKDSWDKVLARIQEKQESKRCLLFRKLSSAAIAASILLVAGACFIGMGSSNSSFESEFQTESYSWFSSLGSGESVSTFATAFDNYYPTGE